MELECEEGFHFLLKSLLLYLVKKISDGLVKSFGGVEIPTVEDFLFNKFPEPFDDIEVWGVRGEKKQGDVEAIGKGNDSDTVLIACVVEYQRDGDAGICLPDLEEEFHDHFGVDIGIIDQGGKLLGDGIDSPEDIDAIASCP